MRRANHLQPTTQVNSALHLSWVAKSSTSFGLGKGGNVTYAGWQVTLCDPIWHQSSVAVRRFRELLYTTLTFYHVLCRRARGGRVCAGGRVPRRTGPRHGREDGVRPPRYLHVRRQSPSRTCQQHERHLPVVDQPATNTRCLVLGSRRHRGALRRPLDALHTRIHVYVNACMYVCIYRYLCSRSSLPVSYTHLTLPTNREV